ncbi:MAG TPA: hypothetical protein VMD99_15285 [Terriglobales bacterium]|nr:hypothetical protein [Terriglobales bacterium]
MAEKIPVLFAKLMDVDAGRSEVLARERKEGGIAQLFAIAASCSAGAPKKFGEHVAAGYRVKCNHTGREFWVWGADRQMNDIEIAALFRRQIEAKLIPDC